ncbi:MAG: hypothetical protein P4L86_15345 [Mycobacterium sp.]|nr:hypothetical protein [Mycobacterium sp.]
MATHLRLAAVAWLAAAPVIGAGLANATPHDIPEGPSTPPVPVQPSAPGTGTSHSGLPSIGDVSKFVGGVTSSLTTAGSNALTTGGAAASSIGQQLVPKVGDGRNGSNTSPGTSVSSSPVGGSSASGDVAGTPATAPLLPAAAPPANPVSVPWVQAGDTANAAAAAVVDASTAPVTALAAELPPIVGVPLENVAALPEFFVDQVAPIVNGVTSTLTSLNVVPVSTAPRLDSPDRGFGPASKPLSVGSQQNSGSAGNADVAGAPSAPRPAPVDHTFAADNKVVAGQPFRAGYSDDLRAAGLSEVAAVAVPGFTGILVLTGAGGLIGFRQARAGRSLHAATGARFMTP